MGARSKLTPETQARILQGIELGATYALAAAYGGVAYETFRRWMHAYKTFSDAVHFAEGRAAVVWLAKIEKAAGDGNWQAAAWKLERRYPAEYGRTIQEHAGELKTTVEFVNDWRTPHPATGEGASDGSDA